MTSLTKQKIFEKLENLREYLSYLYQLKKESGDEKNFISDFHLFGNAERYLQLSIQSVIDISHLVIIDLNQKRPEDNYEAISIIYDNRVITEELVPKVTAMVGLRNILVHEYGKIDRKKIYEILISRLEDLEEFKRQILNYVQPSS